jgi:Cft2 family RNA processing exonuclease
VLIVESTFGTDNIPPRDKRERDFTKAVESIVRRGGSCLIPVFALGRAQELLLILNEHWAANPQLHHVPIYFASALASKCACFSLSTRECIELAFCCLFQIVRCIPRLCFVRLQA